MTEVKKAARWEHPHYLPFNELIAVLGDGRKLSVCVQYHSVQPLGEHAPTCSMVTKMGGTCDCGLLDDIDVEAILADAKAYYKAQEKEEEEKEIEQVERCKNCGKVVDPTVAYSQMEMYQGVKVLTYYCDDCHRLLSTIGAGEYTPLEETAA